MKKQDEDRLWIKASACFGGIAVGALWNAGGTVHRDALTYNAMSGNVAGAGNGGDGADRGPVSTVIGALSADRRPGDADIEAAQQRAGASDVGVAGHGVQGAERGTGPDRVARVRAGRGDQSCG